MSRGPSGLPVFSGCTGERVTAPVGRPRLRLTMDHTSDPRTMNGSGGTIPENTPCKPLTLLSELCSSQSIKPKLKGHENRGCIVRKHQAPAQSGDSREEPQYTSTMEKWEKTEDRESAAHTKATAVSLVKLQQQQCECVHLHVSQGRLGPGRRFRARENVKDRKP
ncbi:hypothetical protein CB1_001033023 [Camelus ferus]|nr:hypothetical protein CB1_001033023 [Camelus ferus]